MKPSLVATIFIVAVFSGSAAFLVAKSVISHCDSQVVTYLKEKEAERKVEVKKIREAEQAEEDRLHEIRKKLLKSRVE